MKQLGVMAAMEEELNKFRYSLENRSEIEIGGKKFYTGKFNGVPTVVVWSGWGKVASSSTASILLSRFNIDSLIFIGVAGAINEDLNIGDIVVSTQTYQHDMDATPLMPKYQIPSVNQTFFHAEEALKDMASSSSNDFLSNIQESINPQTLTKFNITSPKAVEGIIASGDKFVSTAEDLKNLHPEADTKAVEMEGAAVAQVCTSFNTPFVIIRTMSDKANSDSHIDFPAFVSSIASVYSFEILSRMIKSPRLQSISDSNALG